MNKIILNLTKWMNGEKASPSVVEFKMTDGCNQKCKFCNFPLDAKYPTKNMLLDKDYYRLVKEASELNVDEIRLCGGGEPLFKKNRALKLISLTKKYNIHCRLITNGTLLNENDIKNFVELEVDYINFSIHGTNAETHDYLTGLKGAFEKTINNMKYFKFWKSKLGKRFPEISVYFILNKSNYKKIKDITKVFFNLGISRFEIYDLDMRSEECNDLKLSQKDKDSIKKDILEVKKTFKKAGIEFYFQETLFSEFNKKGENKKKNKMTNVLRIDTLKKDLLNVPCYEPWYYLAINGDGSVWQCPNIGTFNLTIKNKSIREFWYGIEMQKIRNLVLNKHLKGDCSFCCFTDMTIPIREALKKMKLKKNG